MNTPAVDSLEQVVADMRCTSHCTLQGATDQCGRWADRIAALTRPPGGSEQPVIVRGPSSQQPMWFFAADWSGEHYVTRDPIGPLPSPQGAEQRQEDRFEQFVQAGIARSPEPLRELGEYLGRVLDEDEFPTADRLLLQLATTYATPHPEQAATQGDARGARDREADRQRFSDPAFNRWLDEGISDAGHTVWDAVPDIACAWQAWDARPYYTKPSDQQGVSLADAARDCTCQKYEGRDCRRCFDPPYPDQSSLPEVAPAATARESVPDALRVADAIRALGLTTLADELETALAHLYAGASPTGVQAAQVADAVNRFLRWKLPKDFHPDGGISFTPVVPYPAWTHCWPVGTNLFSADQARAMFEHCLAQPVSAPAGEDAK